MTKMVKDTNLIRSTSCRRADVTCPGRYRFWPPFRFLATSGSPTETLGRLNKMAVLSCGLSAGNSPVYLIVSDIDSLTSDNRIIPRTFRHVCRQAKAPYPEPREMRSPVSGRNSLNQTRSDWPNLTIGRR